MTFPELLHRVQLELDESRQNLLWGLKLTPPSGMVPDDAINNAMRHEDRPSGVASQAGYRLQAGTTTSQPTSSQPSLQSPGRNGTQSPAEGVVIRTVGSSRVAIRDGYVVSAEDLSGSKWNSADLQKNTKPGYRRLTHALVLLAALAPVSVTIASAHQPAPTQQRLVLQQVPVDRPEELRDIPADPPPPAPSPTPMPPPPPPKPVTPPVQRPVTVAPSQQAVANIIRAAAAKWGANPDQLIRVAMCESHLNPNSYNASSGATGLFQFKPGTFYGHGGHNIWDATDQAEIAAHMFAQGLAYEWGCK